MSNLSVGVDIDCFKMLGADSLCVEASTLWDLCTALWASIISSDHITSETSYTCQLARREAVSQWLTSCSAANINNEVQSADLKVVCLFSCSKSMGMEITCGGSNMSSTPLI